MITEKTWTYGIKKLLPEGWRLHDECGIERMGAHDGWIVVVHIPGDFERWRRIEFYARNLWSVADVTAHICDVFDFHSKRIADEAKAQQRWSPYPWSPHA